MLDPDWQFLGHLNPGWPKKARTSHDALTDLADSYREESRKSKRKVSIAIGLYQYMPNWHGFALENSRVYLTTCSWRENPPESGKRHLVGGENPYFVVHAEHGGIESWLAGVFTGWFDYAFNWSSRRSRRNQAVRRKQR